MPIFSRKSSREAALQKIYTEAYQSSLQSILKESSFEFRASLDLWKQTLAQITAGMGQLDGGPPRTGQEKSLLASIMDIERQCHDRISALETRLRNARSSAGTQPGATIASPYGTQVTNKSTGNVLARNEATDSAESIRKNSNKPQRVAVGAKAPTLAPSSSGVTAGSGANSTANLAAVPSYKPATPDLGSTVSSPLQKLSLSSPGSNSSASTSPAFDFTEKFPSTMPHVSDMPYNMYSKKPIIVPVASASQSNSAPQLASVIASNKQKKQQLNIQQQKEKTAQQARLAAQQPFQQLQQAQTSLQTQAQTQAQQHAAQYHAQQQAQQQAEQQHARLQQKQAQQLAQQQHAQQQAQLAQQQAQQAREQQAQQQAAQLAAQQLQAQQQAQLQAQLQAQQQSQQAAQQSHRSSLEYPQPQSANHGHSLLLTLRGSNPLKNRNKRNSMGAQPASRPHTPSPHTSGESVVTKEQNDLVKKHGKPQQPQQSQPTPPQPRQRPESMYQQFNGFDGIYRSDSQPTSPTLGNDESSFIPTPQQQQQQIQEQIQQQLQQNQHQSVVSSQGKRTQFQVTYEKVPTASGRVIYRPRVVRTAVPGTQSPQALGSAGAANSQLQLGVAQQPYQQNNNSSSSSLPGKANNELRVLADGSTENGGVADNFEEMDEWDCMVQEKIKELRGVDKDAAQQIVNEVVLKGDKVQWDDIAGLEKAKASLKETVVYPFLRPDLFMGLREPALGMLLFGPPGTGKTMLARAVATESNSTFFSISASSLTSKFMGESEKLVRALFQLAKALAPSIIFVDEIDSILTQRADSGEHEASRRVKNEFLVQWSDLQAAAAGKSDPEAKVRRVLVLGATNLPWAIDEAARRRFVRRQYIPLPEAYTRQVHLLKLLSHQNHALSAADMDKLVELTDGYSGSDLTALAKDAAMGPLRSLGDSLLTTAPDQIRPMDMSDFVESMRSIRASVSADGLRVFQQWAELYGSSGA